MNIDFASLAGVIAAKGAPILAEVLGAALPFPFSVVAKAAINALAESFGVPADNPEILAQTIQNDPEAGAKIQAIEDRYKTELQAALDFARLQVEQNNAIVAMSSSMSALGKLFFSGWRPAFCWLVVIGTAYIVVADIFHWPSVRPETWNPIWVLFGGLAGLRSVDKFLGTSPDIIKATVGKIVGRRDRK